MTGGRAPAVFLLRPRCKILPCAGGSCSHCILSHLGVLVGSPLLRWLPGDWARLQARLSNLSKLERKL